MHQKDVASRIYSHMNEQKPFAKSWPVTLLAVSFAFSALLASGAYRYEAMHSTNIAIPTITVTGEGEATAVPDIATISFTIDNTSADVKTAQKAVEDTMKKVSAALKDLGVDAKDIKTENYGVNPKYTYSNIMCITAPCPSNIPKLEGYEVSESVSVKVRKIENTGDVLAALGKNEVKNIQGPNFGIENDEALTKVARGIAIQKAKEKASETAKSLGQNLGDIRSYSEGGAYPMPMMYAKGASMDAGTMSVERITLAQGETKIKVTVNLTYSLR